jgi:hypothetical protein
MTGTGVFEVPLEVLQRLIFQSWPQSASRLLQQTSHLTVVLVLIKTIRHCLAHYKFGGIPELGVGAGGGL